MATGNLRVVGSIGAEVMGAHRSISNILTGTPAIFAANAGSGERPAGAEDL
jgi:hypothetical protein